MEGSGAGPAAGSLRTVLAQRSPQALHSVLGPCGPCNMIQNLLAIKHVMKTDRTLRHSGESVRPQVTQTCCSGALDRLTCATVKYTLDLGSVMQMDARTFLRGPADSSFSSGIVDAFPFVGLLLFPGFLSS